MGSRGTLEPERTLLGFTGQHGSFWVKTLQHASNLDVLDANVLGPQLAENCPYKRRDPSLPAWGRRRKGIAQEIKPKTLPGAT